MAAARPRAGVLARGERLRADLLRALRRRRHHRGDTGARPPRRRRHREALRQPHEEPPVARGLRRRPRAREHAHPLCGKRCLARDRRPRALPRYAEPRLFPDPRRWRAARRARAFASAPRSLRARAAHVMETAGLWMLAAAAVLMLATGLPAWVAISGVALAFSAAGIALGAFGPDLMLALYPRIVGLLENDLLQALPL